MSQPSTPAEVGSNTGLGPLLVEADMDALAAVAHQAGLTGIDLHALARVLDAAQKVAVAAERERWAPAIIGEVAAERARQDAKWGGPAHDDEHSTAEFVQLIEDYAGWARTMAGMSSHNKAERRLIQVAALAVAAVESSRRRRGA